MYFLPLRCSYLPQLIATKGIAKIKTCSRGISRLQEISSYGRWGVNWENAFDDGAAAAANKEVQATASMIHRDFPDDPADFVTEFVGRCWEASKDDPNTFFQAEEVLWRYMEVKPVEVRPKRPFSVEYVKTLDNAGFLSLNPEEQATILFYCKHGHEFGVSASLVKGIAHVKVDDTHAPAPRSLK